VALPLHMAMIHLVAPTQVFQQLLQLAAVVAAVGHQISRMVGLVETEKAGVLAVVVDHTDHIMKVLLDHQAVEQAGKVILAVVDIMPMMVAHLVQEAVVAAVGLVLLALLLMLVATVMEVLAVTEQHLQSLDHL